jgi:hypothetical protein
MFDFHQPNPDPDGEYDEDWIHDYIDGLMAEYTGSTEAQRLPQDRLNWVHPMLSFGFNYVGVSPGDMTRNDFEEVLFELFPHKVSTGADQAESIIAELRAFWTFVARQYAATNAATMLSVLNDNAVNRLRTELANSANFGIAKSLFMTGSQSGYDMTSPEGIAAFTAVYNASLQTGSKVSIVMRHSTANSLKKKRKEKRKQRQAKKHNRSR